MKILSACFYAQDGTILIHRFCIALAGREILLAQATQIGFPIKHAGRRFKRGGRAGLTLNT